MTFRARPVVKRTHRPSWESDNRRTLLTTIGFGLVILAALVILAGAAFASWYGDHLSSVASVNGVAITKDDLRDEIKVAQFRVDHAKSLIRDAVSAGRISEADASQQTSALDQALQNVTSVSLEELIDAELQRQLAAQEGVTVSDADISARLTEEATSKEQRHVWVIAVKPEVSADATAPTDAQKAAAKAKADAALKDLQGGKAWADVAKAVSTDASAASEGDLGWASATETNLDPAFHTALFAAQQDKPTDVIEGADGTYRIGRVTEITPPAVDPNYQQSLADHDLSLDTYRRVLRSDVTKDKLEAKVVADLTEQPSVQRHVSEIFIAASTGGGTGDEVKVKHILYSPNNDPNAASTLDPNDPAWKKAEDAANAAYDELKKDPSKFDELAKTQSSDTASGANGGELPFYTKDSVVPEFANAIFADGLKKGDILKPVKSQFGYHVIEFLERRGDPKTRIDQAKADLAKPGADFAAIAKSVSEGPEAANGGDIGWVAKNQLDSQLEERIFLVPVGSMSDVLETSTGFYIFWIQAEETRTPDASQVETLKKDGFANWYAAKKSAATITREAAAAPASS